MYKHLLDYSSNTSAHDSKNLSHQLCCGNHFSTRGKMKRAKRNQSIHEESNDSQEQEKLLVIGKELQINAGVSIQDTESASNLDPNDAIDVPTSGGLYDRICLFEPSRKKDKLFVRYVNHRCDVTGKTFAEIFGFKPNKNLKNASRLKPSLVHNGNDFSATYVYFRIEDKTTEGRLANLLDFQNSHFRKCKTVLQIQAMYSQMVATYPEKLMMDYTFPPIDVKTNQHIYHNWCGQNLRSRPVTMPITSDSDACGNASRLPSLIPTVEDPEDLSNLLSSQKKAKKTSKKQHLSQDAIVADHDDDLDDAILTQRSSNVETMTSSNSKKSKKSLSKKQHLSQDSIVADHDDDLDDAILTQRSSNVETMTSSSQKGGSKRSSSKRRSITPELIVGDRDELDDENYEIATIEAISRKRAATKDLIVADSSDKSDASDNESGISDIAPPRIRKENKGNVDNRKTLAVRKSNASQDGSDEGLVSLLVQELLPRLEASMSKKLDEVKNELLEQITIGNESNREMKDLCSKIHDMSITSSKWIKAASKSKPRQNEDQSEILKTNKAILEQTSVMQQQMSLLRTIPVEKESVARQIVMRHLPADRLNIGYDYFFACDVVMQVLQTAIVPRIDKIEYVNMKSKLGGVLNRVMFTNSARAHMILGEKLTGTLLKIWFKRAMPYGCVKIAEEVVTSYLQRRKVEEPFLRKTSIQDIKYRMGDALSGDRQRFVDEICKKAPSGKLAMKALYQEALWFWKNNRHANKDVSLSYDQFFHATQDITAVRKKLAEDKEGDDDEDDDDIPDVSTVDDDKYHRYLENTRKGAGDQVHGLEDATKIIAAVCLALDKNPESVSFSSIEGIVKPKKKYLEQLAQCEDVTESIRKWRSQDAMRSVMTPAKESGSEDDFRDEEEERIKSRKRKAIEEKLESERRKMKRPSARSIKLAAMTQQHEQQQRPTSLPQTSRSQQIDLSRERDELRLHQQTIKEMFKKAAPQAPSSDEQEN